MSLRQLQKNVKELYHISDTILKKKIPLREDPASVVDFSMSQQQQYRRSYLQIIRKVQESIQHLPASSLILNELQKLSRLREELDNHSPKNVRRVAEEIASLCAQAVPPDEELSVPSLSLPSEIKEDILADLAEVNTCISSGCYRSVVILCGRMLEVALHRKYFEATGNDALEKSPGIGLGNLIAKMVEKGVPLDPALSQQIHLINQVRIFSVHKKQEAFAPSKEQAQAIILYTVDVLKKFFGVGK